MASSSISSPTLLALPVIVTVTDVVYTTVPYERTEIPTTKSLYSETDPWVVNMHHLLPMLGFFAGIGILALLGGLLWLAFRFCHEDPRRRRLLDHEEKSPTLSISSAGLRTRSSTMSHFASRHVHDGQGWLGRVFGREFHSQRPTRNAPQASFSTDFVPIETSPLKLVSREEILNDPLRRRGIDELALWESKNNTRRSYVFIPDYRDTQPTVSLAAMSTSPASSKETIQYTPVATSSKNPQVVSRPQPEKSVPAPSHVALARQALASTRLENTSSLCLSLTRSRSF